MPPEAARLEKKLLEGLTSARVLPSNKRDEAELIVSTVLQAEMYSGPMPHPAHFAQFEQTLPGSADRILTMTELEQAHRHSWEDKALAGEIFTVKFGQVGGVIGMLTLIACGTWLAFNGHDAFGIAALAPPIFSGLFVLLKGWRKDTAVPVSTPPQTVRTRREKRMAARR